MESNREMTKAIKLWKQDPTGTRNIFGVMGSGKRINVLGKRKQDTESNSSVTEARDSPLHQHNEQGMFVRSIGTQTEETTTGMNITSTDSQTHTRKTYNSTGMETDISGVADSRSLRTLFNCALSVCNAEKVCRDGSVRVRSMAQTKGADGDSCNICEVRQLERHANQLGKARNEELNMSSLKKDVFQEQRPISHQAIANVNKEDCGKIIEKGLVPQISCGFNNDKPVSNDIDESDLSNELVDAHHDIDLEIYPCVRGTCVSYGEASGKKKSRNDLIENNQSDVEDHLETPSSEKFHSSGRRSESSGATTIHNSILAESSNEMPAECESIPECLENNVTMGQIHVFLDIEEKDAVVDPLTVKKVSPHELPDNPAEDVTLEWQECEKWNSDTSRQNMLSSFTDPANAVGHVEDEILSISGEPCCTDTVENQEQPMSTEEGHLKCSQCEKAFKFRSLLERHFRTHTGEKPYKCTQCDKSFKARYNLSIHFLLHTGERPYKCTQCSKTFRQRGNLSVHLRFHTGERPCKCTWCDKTFKQRCELSAHLRTHTGERPFKCTQCGKAFKRKHHLTAHCRTHTTKHLNDLIHKEKRPQRCLSKY